MLPDVFISYSSKDAALAQSVCRSLEQAGIGCWIAPRDIQGGMPWSDAIMRALDACQIVVLLLSSTSNVSVQVHNEINEATNLKKHIVPIRVEDVPLSRHMAYYLGRLHWLSALTGPFESHLPAVVEAVQGLLTAGEQDFVPPASVVAAPLHNLPRQRSSFIGREKERREIQEALASHPLVTLTGPGGIGKTRLALSVALEAVEHCRDGVWLVELAALTEENLVTQTVAGVLGLREEPGRPIHQTLTDYLKTRHLLLILDNCEHLIHACSTLADVLLKACPQLTILATSREGMNIPGESIYRLHCLSLPDIKASAPASLQQSEAARLFVERALQVKPDFTVTAQNAPAVASLCHRLDGIPLALELAAARARSLSVEDINNRLDQRLRLLTGGSRTALPRQQTLKALIDWSYDLLTPQEQILLARLSIFVGGWTLEAAEQVCSAEGIEDWEALDLLTSLADKSLSLLEEKDGSVRYRLLETVREYGAEKMLQSGEGATLRRRHRDWCLTFSEEARMKLIGAEQARWLNLLERDHDNLRQALTFCLEETGEAGPGLRLVAALQQFWGMRGHLSEGRDRSGAALSHPEAQARTKVRASVLNGAGLLAQMQGDFASALALHEESLVIKRELGDRSGIAVTLHNMGGVACHQGDYVSARALYEQSLAMQRELGDQSGIAYSLNNLGVVIQTQGDFATARSLFEESLTVFRPLGDKRGISMALHNLGSVAAEEGDRATARSLYEESLAIQWELGDQSGIASSLEAFVRLWIEAGHIAQAVQLWGASERLREEIGSPLPSDEQEAFNRTLATARQSLGEEAFLTTLATGRALSPEQAIACVLTYALEGAVER